MNKSTKRGSANNYLTHTKLEKGITLIALIITIIVLLILAGVTIATLTGENGLLNKAETAKETTEQKTAEEQVKLAIMASYNTSGKIDLGELKTNLSNIKGITGVPDEITDDSFPFEVTIDGRKIELTKTGETITAVAKGGTETQPTISATTSYVGYYADIDGDGTPDGVIYADLAFSVSGKWDARSSGAFSYSAISETKSYYISQTDYAGDFGTKDVLTATGSGVDRFYVMDLDNFREAGTKYCWYDAANDSGITDYSTVTSASFGTGKTNTSTMISKWNSGTYGAQNDNSGYADVWGAIQGRVSDGWFVPSTEEWSAFGYNLGIEEDDFGLSESYLTSTLRDEDRVRYVDMDGAVIETGDFDEIRFVRLSTVF